MEASRGFESQVGVVWTCKPPCISSTGNLQLLWLVLPLPIWQYRSRLWLLRQLGLAFVPVCRVTFTNFWLMDQLTSQSHFFTDVAYSLCFFATNVSPAPAAMLGEARLG